MRHRAFRSIAAILSILILTGVPAQAGPILINQVVQALGNQNALELRLRAVSQNSSASTLVKTSVHSSTSNVLLVGLLNDDTMQSGVIAIKSDPLKTVQVIDEGNVEGTVCDCGEITVPGGALPKWPLLFLAAIPLLFIHGCDVCDSSTPHTTQLLPLPNPKLVIPPPGVPEPASLILFGSGLAAVTGVMRRRRAKNKLADLIQATDED